MLPTLPLCPFLFQHPREYSQLRYYVFSGITIEFPNIVQAFCLGSKKQWHQWGLCWTREDSMPNWGWWLDQWGHSRSVYFLVDLSLGLIYNLKPNLCHFNTDLDKTFHFYHFYLNLDPNILSKKNVWLFKKFKNCGLFQPTKSSQVRTRVGHSILFRSVRYILFCS